MHKLAIVIPYRNRPDHFNTFMDEAIPYLDKTGIDYRVIVVEQDNASAFNRGMLCNIGFKEAKRLKCDYVVFHDIDMIPIDVDYSYSKHPVHLATDNLPFDTYFGGMTLFPMEDFEKINGFSNFYWGWGFEDDDLRYRCTRHGINYGKDIGNVYEYDGKTAAFNGKSSYIELTNTVKFIRSFTIELDLRLEIQDFSLDKDSDLFPILSIEGYDLTLGYTSFNKFVLQFFDNKGIYYDIFSNTITDRNSKIKFEFNKEDSTVELTVNGKLSGKVELPNRLYNYSKSKTIYIGTDCKFKNFFKGYLDKLKITSGDTELTFSSNNLERGSWINLTGEPIPNKFHNIHKTKVNLEQFKSYKIPHRRNSKIKRTPHEDAGFVGGRWKSDLTRYNQLRFNNEVLKGDHDNLDDGLSTCEFIKHKSLRNKKIVKLTVGI